MRQLWKILQKLKRDLLNKHWLRNYNCHRDKRRIWDVRIAAACSCFTHVFIVGCEEHIARVDEELKVVSLELEEWINFRVSVIIAAMCLFSFLYNRMLLNMVILQKLPAWRKRWRKWYKRKPDCRVALFIYQASMWVHGHFRWIWSQADRS